MKNYLENLISEVKTNVDLSKLPDTRQAVEKAEEILQDPKFIQQREYGHW